MSEFVSQEKTDDPLVRQPRRKEEERGVTHALQTQARRTEESVHPLVCGHPGYLQKG